MHKKITSVSGQLRKKAEAFIKNRGEHSSAEYSESDILKLIHELEVYQIELEMQNEELGQAAALENELLKLTVQMNSMKGPDYQAKVELALSSVGHFLSSDRVYIFEIDESDNTITNTYEWCNKGIQPEIKNLKNIPANVIPKWMETLKTQEYISIPSVSSLPDSWIAERKILEQQGVQSLLVIPVLIENKLAGFVGLDEVKKPREYTPFEIKTLKIWSNLLAGLINNKHLESIIEQTKQNYENFFNTIDDFLIVIDTEGNIVHVNQKVIEKLGYTEDELIGNSVLIIHPPERREEADKIVWEMLLGNVDSCPIPIITKSGVQIPVETRVSYGSWNGKPAILGVSKDISEIALSEEKFSKVFHVNPSACGLSYLENGKYSEVNKAFVELFGFKNNEVIGKTPMELGIMTEKTREKVLLNADENENVNNAEAELFTKNGELKHVLLSSENIYIQEKKYRFTVVQDITEQKQAELAIYEQNQKINAILSATPDGIGIISFDGKLKFISNNLAVMYGYSLEEKDVFIGQSFLDFCEPTEHEKIERNIRKIIEGKNDQKITEYEVIKKDKSRFYVGVKSTLIIGYNGSPEDILFVQRDITNQKQAEKELIEKEQHLLELNASKDKFFSIISHDLKTPFNSILGFSSLMLQEMENNKFENLKKYAGIINDSSERAVNLISNLLEWSRLQTGKLEFNAKKTDLGSVVNEVIELLSASARLKSIKIKKEIPLDFYSFSDEEMIKTVLRNLVSNAIKFTHPGGKIHISAAQESKHIIVKVKDNGVGIEKEVMEKLLRIDENISTYGTLKEKGSGLGLLLCKEFAEKNGGKLWIESEEGKGTSVYFSIPLAKS